MTFSFPRGGRYLVKYNLQRMMIALALTGLIAGCGRPTPDLLGQAHQAASALNREPGSADFDDSFTQVFPEKGLVCGGKVHIRARFTEDAGYQHYYFSQTGGLALEGASPAWLPLANACIRAMMERLAVVNHRLATEAQGN